VAEFKMPYSEKKITPSPKRVDDHFLEAVHHVFRELFDYAHDAILTTYGDDVVHCYVNHRACDITGYNIKELINLGIMDLVHPEERVKIENQFKNQPKETASPCCYKTRIVTKNGDITPVELTVSKSMREKNGLSFVVLKDISKEGQLENEMNKSFNSLKAKLRKREGELKTVSKRLHHHQKELMETRLELEHLNRGFVHTKQAMSAMAKNIDREKRELEEKVFTIITTKIMPIVKNLQTDERIKKYWPEINSMAEHLNTMARKNNLVLKTISVLTETEMKIATMVKNGFTSKKIANLMHISIETVKAHRRNIRRKLKIHNTKWKLSSYLLSVLGNE
jgi:PAS domain S-box-containing protein